jgi:hypothetical protein
MRFKLLVAAASLVAAGLVSASAQADMRFRVGAVFDDYAPPPPDVYFFDDGDQHDAATDPQDLYGDVPSSVYDYDPGYYEPRLVKPQKRIDRVRAGLRAQIQRAKPPVQSVKVAAVEPKAPVASVKPKSALLPKLVLPPEKPSAVAAAVTCDKGATIVKGYGFADVKAKTCSGDVFAFNATRDGKPYEILLSSKNGALTEVKRQ